MSGVETAANRHVVGLSERDARGAAAQATLQRQRERAGKVANLSTAALEGCVAAPQVELEQHASTHQQIASTPQRITGSGRMRWSAALDPLHSGSGGQDR